MVRLISASLVTMPWVSLLFICQVNGQGTVKTLEDPSFHTSTELGIKGTQFTINGTPTFLYGISYYGALGASEDFILRDLTDIKKYGFNWIRVWATWDFFGNNVSAVDANGNPREPFFTKLKWLVAEFDREGIIVDVTLHRNKDDSHPVLPNLDSHRRAVETIIRLLKPYNNWYIDLANEHHVRDKRFVSLEEIKQLSETAKKTDSGLLVTASGGVENRDYLSEYLQNVNIDFICPHGRRFAGSPEQTEAKAREHLSSMEEIGRIVPLHFQEPFRRGYNKWTPTANDFITDVINAKAGGAAQDGVFIMEAREISPTAFRAVRLTCVRNAFSSNWT